MGQKVSPTGLRIGINKDWESKWYAENDFAKYLNNDYKIRKYLNFEFSTGCTTGEDYKEFERKYINYLKKMCQSYGWELVKPRKGHYELSAFIKKQDQYVYLSISDVRYFLNEW